MTDFSASPINPSSSLSPEETEDLVRQLRRKEGNWVGWGEACQKLLKSGFNPQSLFEETGFEPVQQNQVIVGAQVFASITSGNVEEAVREYFERKGSDILYEFRILNNAERQAAATFAYERKMDMDEAHDLAKAMRDYSRTRNVPEAFKNHPGDAIAYECWRLARQKDDLQERSRLIARGLQFVHSTEARQYLEKLLTDFTVVSRRPKPLMPIYRMESDEESPRIVPVAGRLPLKRDDLQAVPFSEDEPPFGIVKFSGTGAWVPLPGWQVLVNADDPVAVLTSSQELPTPFETPEEVMVVVDRAQRTWEADAFFIAESTEGGSDLQIQWFEDAPEVTILGRVLMILRAKRIFDANVARDLWQFEE